MSKIIFISKIFFLMIFAVFLLLIIIQMPIATAVTYYLNTTLCTSVVGGTSNKFGCLFTTNSSVLDDTTSKKNAKSTGLDYWQAITTVASWSACSGASCPPASSSPVGYGWAISPTFVNDTIPAGNWSFGIVTTPSATGTGHLFVDVWKTCGGTDTRILYINLNRTDNSSVTCSPNCNIMGTAAATTYNLTFKQTSPISGLAGCYLKAEYWLNITKATGSSTATIKFRSNVSTTNVSFPTPTDTLAPQWFNNETNFTIPAVYLNPAGYQFNVTWNETYPATVLIEHNFTGVPTNYTVTAWRSNSGREYYYNYSTLNLGGYYWRMYANDTSGNFNMTDNFTFIVYTPTLSANWTYPYSGTSQVNDSSCTQGSPCPYQQYQTFNISANVTCLTNPSGQSCGSITGGVMYNDTTTSYKWMNTTAGASPFYIVGMSVSNRLLSNFTFNNVSQTFSFGNTAPAPQFRQDSYINWLNNSIPVEGASAESNNTGQQQINFSVSDNDFKINNINISFALANKISTWNWVWADFNLSIFNHTSNNFQSVGYNNMSLVTLTGTSWGCNVTNFSIPIFSDYVQNHIINMSLIMKQEDAGESSGTYDSTAQSFTCGGETFSASANVPYKFVYVRVDYTGSNPFNSGTLSEGQSYILNYTLNVTKDSAVNETFKLIYNFTSSLYPNLPENDTSIAYVTKLPTTRTLLVNWTYPYSVTSQLNDSSCTQGSPCNYNQNYTFNASANVTCITNPSGLSCGSITGGIMYNDTTTTYKFVNTTAGATPFYTNTIVGATNWLSGWQYRKSHVINSASGTGKNYQILINVFNSTGTDSGNSVYIGSHSSSNNFGDIRFTSSDGSTQLPYWMESLTSTNATFWVNISDDLSSSSSTIYLYYGKSSVTTTSNGTNTFVFFDDFDSSPNGWTLSSGSSITSGRLQMVVSGASYQDAYKQWTPLTNYRFRLTYSTTQTNNGIFLKVRAITVPVINDTGATQSPYIRGYDYSLNPVSPGFLFVGQGGNSTSAFTFARDSNTYTVELTKSGSTFNLTRGSTSASVMDSTTETGNYVDLINQWNSGGTAYVYWVFASKYVNPEPSQGSWGSEETGIPNPSSIGTLNYGSSYLLNYTVNATGTDDYKLIFNFTSSTSGVSENDTRLAYIINRTLVAPPTNPYYLVNFTAALSMLSPGNQAKTLGIGKTTSLAATTSEFQGKILTRLSTISLSSMINDIKSAGFSRSLNAGLSELYGKIFGLSLTRMLTDFIASFSNEIRGLALTRLFSTNMAPFSNEIKSFGVTRFSTVALTSFSNDIKKMASTRLFTTSMTGVSNDVKGLSLGRLFSASLIGTGNEFQKLNLGRLFGASVTSFSNEIKNVGFLKSITTSLTSVSNELRGLTLTRLFTSSMTGFGSRLDFAGYLRLFTTSVSPTGNEIGRLTLTRLFATSLTSVSNEVKGMTLMRLLTTGVTAASNDVEGMNLGRLFTNSLTSTSNRIKSFGISKFFTTTLTAFSDEIKNLGFLQSITGSLTAAGNEIKSTGLLKSITTGLTTFGNEIGRLNLGRLFTTSVTGAGNELRGLTLTRLFTNSLTAIGNDLSRLGFTRMFTSSITAYSNKIASTITEYARTITANLGLSGLDVKGMNFGRLFATSLSSVGNEAGRLTLTRLFATSLTSVSNEVRTLTLTRLFTNIMTGFSSKLNFEGYLKSITASLSPVSNEIKGLTLTRLFTTNLTPVSNELQKLTLTRLFTTSLTSISNEIRGLKLTRISTTSLTTFSNEFQKLNLGRLFGASVTSFSNEIKNVGFLKLFTNSLTGVSNELRGFTLTRLFTTNLAGFGGRIDSAGYLKSFTASMSSAGNEMKGLSLGRLFTTSVSSMSNDIRTLNMGRLFTPSLTMFSNEIGRLTLTRLFTGSLTGVGNDLNGLTLTRLFTTGITSAGNEIKNIGFLKLFTTSLTGASNEIKSLGFFKAFTNSLTPASNNVEGMDLGRLFSASLNGVSNELRRLTLTRLSTVGLMSAANDVKGIGFLRIFTSSMTSASNEIRGLHLIRTSTQSITTFVRMLKEGRQNVVQSLTTTLAVASNDIRELTLARIFTTSLTSMSNELKGIGFLRLFTTSLTSFGNDLRELTLTRLFTTSVTGFGNEIKNVGFLKLFTNSLTGVGNDVRGFTLTRLFTSSLTAASNEIKSIGFLRLFTTSLSSASNEIRGLSYLRLFTTNLTTIINEIRSLTLTRLFVNGLSTASNEIKSAGFLRMFTTSMTAVGNDIKSLRLTRLFTTGMASFSNEISSRGYVRLFTTALTAAGNEIRGLQLIRMFTNSITSFVNIIKEGRQNVVQSFTAALTASSNELRGLTLTRLFTSSMTGFSSRLDFAGYLRLFTTSVSPTGNEIGRLNLGRLFTTGLTTVGNDLRKLTLTRTFAGYVTATSNIVTSRIREYVQIITASLSTVENQIRSLSFSRLFTGSLSLTDNETRKLNLTIIFNNFLSFLQKLFKSIFVPEVSTPAPITTPSSSGGGGGPSTGIPSIIAPTIGPAIPTETRVVEYLQAPIVQEVSPGQSTDTRIVLRNKLGTNVKNMKIIIEGISQEWVKTSVGMLDFKPGETKSFNLKINVPNNAEPGDKIVTIKLVNGDITDVSQFLLRVEQQYANEITSTAAEKTSVSRTVSIDRTNNEIDVKLKVSVSDPNQDTVEVYEEIPKTIATSTKQIKFGVEPTKILQDDPLVMWKFSGLEPNETREIQYAVSKTSADLRDLTAYLYWPLKQVNVYKEKLPIGFRLVELTMPDMFTGTTGEIKAVIENPENVSRRFEMDLELPLGWEKEPQRISEIIAANGIEEFIVKVRIPSDATPGKYLTKLMFTWNGASVVREYTITLQSFMQLAAYWLPIIAGLGIGGFFAARYYVLKKGMRSQKREALEKLRNLYPQKVLKKEFVDVTKLVAGIRNDVGRELKERGNVRLQQGTAERNAIDENAKEELKKEIMENIRRKLAARHNQ